MEFEAIPGSAEERAATVIAHETERERQCPPKQAEKDVSQRAIMLAQTVWQEARGLGPEEWALICWAAFQRVDDDRWPDTLEEVLEQPRQFAFRRNAPVEEKILAVCAEELEKWQNGDGPPIHELYAPSAPYYFFDGGHRIGEDGKPHNVFREEWRR
jgi:spore germination cell wall hydrolase CwlJ-like protein